MMSLVRGWLTCVMLWAITGWVNSVARVFFAVLFGALVALRLSD